MNKEKITSLITVKNAPLLVFGGVYSNLQALDKMKEIADELHIPPQQILCTGDIVGYCAQPEEVVQFVKKWGIHCIAGNVEIQLRDGEEDCGCDFNSGSRCDLFSRKWYPYAQSKLSAESIAWMKSLHDFISFKYVDKQVLMVHGSYFGTSDYVFESSVWNQKQSNFDASQSDIILAGHCGLPFHTKNQDKIWFNSGVIGMPANDGTSRVWYGLISSNEEELIFEHCSFNYHHEKAAELMRTEKLPLEYAKTLETGLWDNCEILPEQETNQQGIQIEKKQTSIAR